MKTRARQLGITEFPYWEFDENGYIVYSESVLGAWYRVRYHGLVGEIYCETHVGNKRYVIK
tara:strand:- start:4451 stop:4633 length:183 start_codon:yes stop_codon:yes gene_type:complete